MSEEIITEVTEVSNEPEVVEVSNEPETVEVSNEPETVEKAESSENPGIEDVQESLEAPEVNYADKSLAALVGLFEEFSKSGDRIKLFKDAEAIKSAFYRKLQKEKSEVEESALEALNELENGFRTVYNEYKKERAQYNAALEKEREENLAAKQAVIEDLKALLEKQEDVDATFPAFREIQKRWREIGPVPQQSFRNLNDTYQLYVEQFYDMLKINRELRDLDFKKNLEAKEVFCAAAEKLAENENVVAAFNELQKLHEQWKELGPVAKEYREDIWNRFKAATLVINKRYQAYFEEQKEQQLANLAAKTVLCEKVEEIAAREVASSNEWNTFSKEIEDIQKEWKTIGFATRKENQKIYDRFRAACDAFYTRKRDFYNGYKDSMNANLEKKTALCEEAEQLKDSTDWKKTADRLIALQKQWKEIGAVPRKKSDQLWKRFRAACDAFFNERDKNVKPENDFYGNLKAKQRLIAQIREYELTGDKDEDAGAMEAFAAQWQSIGFVPFKEKDNIAQAYKEAMSRFPDASRRQRRPSRPALSPKEKLVAKYNQLEQDIVTYENNIGFFAMSKNSAPLIRQMEERIAQAKEELKSLEKQIREMNAEGE